MWYQNLNQTNDKWITKLKMNWNSSEKKEQKSEIQQIRWKATKTMQNILLNRVAGKSRWSDAITLHLEWSYKLTSASPQQSSPQQSQTIIRQKTVINALNTNRFIIFTKDLSITSSWKWCFSRQRMLMISSKITALPDNSSATRI